MYRQFSNVFQMCVCICVNMIIVCLCVCVCQVEDQVSTIEVHNNITNNNKDSNKGEDWACLCVCLCLHADIFIHNPKPVSTFPGHDWGVNRKYMWAALLLIKCKPASKTLLYFSLLSNICSHPAVWMANYFLCYYFFFPFLLHLHKKKALWLLKVRHRIK